MKKYAYTTSYTIGQLPNHQQHKNSLLEQINNASCDSLIQTSDYYGDSINRVDWNNCTDMTRPWVKDIQSSLFTYLDEWAKGYHCKGWNVNQIWFQQYHNTGRHGWHIHGHNYTGVYYLDLPEGTPNTQIANEDGTVITVDVKEGDVLIFPSYVIHRAPVNESDRVKTIISWNMDIMTPDKDYLERELDLLRKQIP